MKNGKIIKCNGDTCWYVKGLLDRKRQPAIIQKNGSKRWYRKGKLHRTDGPAIEWIDGNVEWWYRGEKYYSEQAFKNKLTQQNLHEYLKKVK